MSEQIILRERTFTIKAGETFDQALHGNVLRVTAGAVPLRVQSRDGQLDFTILAGEKARFPDDNPALILSHTSGADQQFTIQVGKGVDVASALLSGSVVISGTPTVINGGGTLTSITNTVGVTDRGAEYSASLASSSALTANTPQTVVSPAANINGILVTDCSVMATHGSNVPWPTLIAKTSAPANYTDGDVIHCPNNGTGSFTLGTMDYPILVPAGKGLYFIDNQTEVQAYRQVKYKLL